MARTANANLDTNDLICLSHLRWDFVFQRPHHLLSRASEQRRVFFFEEPLFCSERSHLKIRKVSDRLWVVTPCLAHGTMDPVFEQRRLLDQLITLYEIKSYVTWYYTPMALKFTSHLTPVVSVYDCMDQLASFKGAPQEIVYLEEELFERVDVAFTGGQSLFEFKRRCHDNIHAYPSSVDVSHFAQARIFHKDPDDQAAIPGPRLGYVGVIDERIDLDLIDSVAAKRPSWQIIMVGPLAKISEDTLPRRANIHYLGGKSYESLPQYLAKWDIAILPFARNDATRFISPTKTPEYLSAGKRVVSTSIRDVVRPYGELGLVEIADESDAFIAKSEAILNGGLNCATWLQQTDEFLSKISWNQTFASMWSHVEALLAARRFQRSLHEQLPAAALLSQRRALVRAAGSGRQKSGSKG